MTGKIGTSYKVAVKVRGEEGWSYNALRFPTKEEAEAHGQDLYSRWMLVEKWEVQESDDPVKVNRPTSHQA